MLPLYSIELKELLIKYFKKMDIECILIDTPNIIIDGIPKIALTYKGENVTPNECLTRFSNFIKLFKKVYIFSFMEYVMYIEKSESIESVILIRFITDKAINI